MSFEFNVANVIQLSKQCQGAQYDRYLADVKRRVMDAARDGQFKCICKFNQIQGTSESITRIVDYLKLQGFVCEVAYLNSLYDAMLTISWK